MQIMGSGYPMERIATDILGPLPETESGNRYILVIGDYFTKWVEAFAIPDQTAQTVARCLVKEVVSRFGVPTYIHSDQGRQFESAVYQEVCALLDIKKTRTTPYHPQSDGMVERFNRTLERLLSAFVNAEHSDWDERLPYVLMAYRSSVNETTGYTPNMMMLGREVTVPLDIQFANALDTKAIHSEFVQNLQETMEQAHEFAREHIGTEMGRQKRNHDSKLSWEKFSVGDEVYVYFPRGQPGRSPKFRSDWYGPFVVTSKLSDITYMVKNKATGSKHVVHVDRMKRRYSREVENEVQSDDESIDDAETDEVESPDSGYQEEGQDGETFGAQEQLEDSAAIELGRGRRQKRRPDKYSDYVL
ncbi:MAG: DDE-type integrase/transposase/recombinase [Candidatus Thiodiazotropha taylori]|nr:DDE-type integrase/transposase/recombinase [Candidatus Thiodiazotropha taylori]MCW4284920.1 DDE-type integrase/transposase/recombinase [Candidatus Thiodiazotropha taylori]